MLRRDGVEQFDPLDIVIGGGELRGHQVQQTEGGAFATGFHSRCASVASQPCAASSSAA